MWKSRNRVCQAYSVNTHGRSPHGPYRSIDRMLAGDTERIKVKKEKLLVFDQFLLFFLSYIYAHHSAHLAEFTTLLHLFHRLYNISKLLLATTYYVRLPTYRSTVHGYLGRNTNRDNKLHGMYYLHGDSLCVCIVHACTPTRCAIYTSVCFCVFYVYLSTYV